MGSHENKEAKPLASDKLVNLKTSDLRERLNKLYARMRSSSAERKLSDNGRFDYLWDLKELALMQGTQSVDVPESWLDDLEKGVAGHPGH
ncbi:MAG: hypothetical protein K2X77_17360 [Candidatus Obscuribacterales bacterium]|jgi:hypothetical protein|nr:hypothetical protein [Candidatus Obscuribacterales bacterium]